MNKYVLMLAAAGLIAAAPVYYAVSAQAEDAVVDAEHAADAAMEEAPATLPEHPAPVEVKETTLQDGTHVIIDGARVSIVAADGAMSDAPDGDHTLADGTVIHTMGGKIVSE